MSQLIDSSGRPFSEQPEASQDIESFTFGDAMPVMERSAILSYIECWTNGKWYEPPVSFEGLAKSFRASVHHSSAIYFKAAILASTLERHPLTSQSMVRALAMDYQIFGNAYLERRKSRTGRTIALKHTPAKYTRRGIEDGQHFFVATAGEEHEFEPGSVGHILMPDINQEIYGLPEYLAALQSAWLNESATLFRRRYYNNGSHAGFLMYLSDASVNTEDVDALRQSLREAKGPGNFRNVFLHAPNGKKDGVQIIPISEVAARDDFFNIKNVSRDDVLAAHRVPPQLMGIVPSATGGFGAVVPAAKVFARNEIKPLQEVFNDFNSWLGEDVFRFSPYVVDDEPHESA